MLDIKVDLFTSISVARDDGSFCVKRYFMGNLGSLGRRRCLGEEEKGGSQYEQHGDYHSLQVRHIEKHSSVYLKPMFSSQGKD